MECAEVEEVQVMRGPFGLCSTFSCGNAEPSLCLKHKRLIMCLNIVTMLRDFSVSIPECYVGHAYGTSWRTDLVLGQPERFLPVAG